MANEEFDTNDPVGSFGATWRRVMVEPQAFFEQLPTAGGIQPALVFAAVSIGVGAVEVLVFGGGFLCFFGFWIGGLVRLFVGSAVVVLVAQSLFEGRGDYEATFRVLGYSSAPAVLLGLPIVRFFAALYVAYLVILGLQRAHSFDAVRSFLTVLASFVTLSVLAYAVGFGGRRHHRALFF